MNDKLFIVVKIEVNPDHVDVVKRELLKLIPTTRAEAGCIRYDLLQDNDQPATFLFYEIWESRELWQIHMKAPHLAAFSEAMEGMIDGTELHEMSQAG